MIDSLKKFILEFFMSYLLRFYNLMRNIPFIKRFFLYYYVTIFICTQCYILIISDSQGGVKIMQRLKIFRVWIDMKFLWILSFRSILIPFHFSSWCLLYKSSWNVNENNDVEFFLHSSGIMFFRKNIVCFKVS